MANMFNEDGTYNKTEWKAGDRITAVKLNKIELSLEAINNNDIDRHVEADNRLDILEERMANTPDNEQMDALEDIVKDNKDAVDLAVYEVNSRMQFLEDELEEAVAEVNADMMAMVAEVGVDLEGLHAKDEELSEQLTTNTKVLKVFETKLNENNDEALQRIFTELPNGGIIHFPEGEFLLSPFVIPKGIIIEGQGSNTTFLKLADGSNNDFITFNDSVSSGLRKLRLNGNKENNEIGSGIVIKKGDVDEDNSRSLVIENIVIDNFAEHGIKVLKPYVWTFYLRFISIWNCNGYGIYNEGTDNDFICIYIYNCAQGALYNEGANNRFISGKWYMNGSKIDENSCQLFSKGVRNQYNNIEIQESYGNGIILDGAWEEQFSNMLIDGCGTGYRDVAVDRVGLHIKNSRKIKFDGMITNQGYNEERLYQYRGLQVDNSRLITINAPMDTSRIKTPYIISEDSLNVDLKISYKIEPYIRMNIKSDQRTTSGEKLNLQSTVKEANRLVYNDTNNTVYVKDDGVYMVKVTIPINSTVSSVVCDVILNIGGQQTSRLFYGKVETGYSITATGFVKLNARNGVQLSITTYDGNTITTMGHELSEFSMVKIS